MKYQLTLAKNFFDKKPMENSKSYKLKGKSLLKNLNHIDSFKSISPLSENQEIELLSEINYNGTLYKPGIAVEMSSNNSLPVFAEIKHIIKSNGIKYFIVNDLGTSYFDEHIQAYIVIETGDWHFVQYENLKSFSTHYPQIVKVPVKNINIDENEHVSKKSPIKLKTKKVIVRLYD